LKGKFFLTKTAEIEVLDISKDVISIREELKQLSFSKSCRPDKDAQALRVLVSSLKGFLRISLKNTAAWNEGGAEFFLFLPE